MAHPFGDKPVFDQREIWPLVEKITSEVGERVGKAAMPSFDSMLSENKIESSDEKCNAVWSSKN
jgi:hypothetical protein